MVGLHRKIPLYLAAGPEVRRKTLRSLAILLQASFTNCELYWKLIRSHPRDARTALKSWHLFSRSKIFPPLTEPRDALPRSQVLRIWPWQNLHNLPHLQPTYALDVRSSKNPTLLYDTAHFPYYMPISPPLRFQFSFSSVQFSASSSHQILSLQIIICHYTTLPRPGVSPHNTSWTCYIGPTSEVQATVILGSNATEVKG
jgi:hypothetical protein